MGMNHADAPNVTPQAVLDRVHAEGGWGSKWVAKQGLYASLVHKWKARGQVPRGWRLALKASLKPLQAPK